MIIPRIVLGGGVSRGMIIPRRVRSNRCYYHVLSLIRRPQPPAGEGCCLQRTAIQQLQLARNATTTTKPLRRRYYSDFAGYGDNNFNQPTFTQAEELVMDMTAWFVAFMLVAIPSIDDDEAVDVKEEDAKGEEERRNPPRRRPTAHFDDWLDYQSLEDLEDEADRRRRRQREKQHSKNSTKTKPSTSDKKETPKHDHRR